MTREERIQLAAETLKCEGQRAAGHWIYHDEPTGWWVVEDSEMEKLGELLVKSSSSLHAVRLWWASSDAIEVDLDRIVRDSEITSETDLDALMHEAGAAGDTVTHLVLMFLRTEVNDTIRINAVIDQDREGEDDR